MAKGGHIRSGNISKQALASAKASAQHNIAAPAHLGDEEKQVWRQYAPLLESDGRLTPKSAEVLARYCVAVARCRKLTDELKNVPSFVVSEVMDRFGNTRQITKAHPLDAMLRQWMLTSRSLENDLLLNPASSLRAPSETPVEGDPFDQFEKDDSSH